VSPQKHQIVLGKSLIPRKVEWLFETGGKHSANVNQMSGNPV
jgi:hypothetical protein